jgi:hypothetical protein
MVVVRRARGKKSSKDWKDLNDNWGKAEYGQQSMGEQGLKLAGAKTKTKWCRLCHPGQESTDQHLSEHCIKYIYPHVFVSPRLQISPSFF